MAASKPLASNPTASSPQGPGGPRVAVVMGSDSDLPTLQPAVDLLDDFGVPVEVRVLSAHRTPWRWWPSPSRPPAVASRW